MIEALFFGEHDALTNAHEIPNDIQIRIDQSEGLPSHQLLAGRVFDVVSGAATPTQIYNAIKPDIGLTAQLMSMASRTRGEPPARHLAMAMDRLGVQKVRAVSTAAVRNCFKENRDIADQLWAHSVAVAYLSKGLSMRQKRVDPELGFTAGLLHDIGKIFLLKEFPGRYRAVHQASAAGGWDFLDAEIDTFGCDHAAIGSQLAAKWGLHEAVQVSIRWHHSLGALYAEGVRGHVQHMVATVRLADDMFRAHRQSDGRMAMNYHRITSEARDILGFSDYMLQQIWEEFHPANFDCF